MSQPKLPPAFGASVWPSPSGGVSVQADSRAEELFAEAYPDLVAGPAPPAPAATVLSPLPVRGATLKRGHAARERRRRRGQRAAALLAITGAAALGLSAPADGRATTLAWASAARIGATALVDELRTGQFHPVGAAWRIVERAKRARRTAFER